MFAQTDIFSLDKWVMVGKDLGIGTMFALVLLALFACGSFYVLRDGFGKQGFVRDFFVGVKDAAIAVPRSADADARPPRIGRGRKPGIS